MNLRLLAERDLGVILEDSAGGFGWNIVLTAPGGGRHLFTGFSDDIAQAIDPETGQIVSSREASVALRMSSLRLAGLELPRAISDTGSRPWTVEFTDILGDAHRFKIIRSHPDRALGLITLILEVYK